MVDRKELIRRAADLVPGLPSAPAWPRSWAKTLWNN